MAIAAIAPTLKAEVLVGGLDVGEAGVVSKVSYVHTVYCRKSLNIIDLPIVIDCEVALRNPCAPKITAFSRKEVEN